MTGVQTCALPIFQLQNLPRIGKSEIPRITAIADSVEPSSDGMGLVANATTDDLKLLIRACLIAPSSFTIADFSNIEARVVAWLAGEDSVLEAIRAGKEIYKITWSLISGMPTEEIGKDSPERWRGKITTLACGYGGGVGALVRMGGNDLPIPEDFEQRHYQEFLESARATHEVLTERARRDDTPLPAPVDLDSVAAAHNEVLRHDYLDHLKNLWRQANPNIVQFWYDLERAFEEAATTGVRTEVSRVVVQSPAKRVVEIVLPSGRALVYRNVHRVTRTETDPETGEETTRSALAYQQGRDLGYTWGGSLTENVTQAVARDVMAEALLRVDRMGGKIVAHIHDEIVVEGDFPLAEQMCVVPEWAKGLPLAADSVKSQRYLGH